MRLPIRSGCRPSAAHQRRVEQARLRLSSESNTIVSRRILLLRRENIGDLILTTPLIHALREHLPDGYLAALVNSYNAPVLAGNGDLDQVFVYTKGKHAGSLTEAIGARMAQARLLLRLRRMRFDDVVLAEPTYTPRNIRTASFILGYPLFPGRRSGTRIIGFEHDDGQSAGLDVIASKANMDGLHMAQIIMRLAKPFGSIDTPEAAESAARCRLAGGAAAVDADAEKLTIALHISARKPSQRWTVEQFSELAHRLHAAYGVRFRVLWSPGDAHNLLHPGDDQKAQALQRALQTGGRNGRPIDAEFVPTHNLQELIATMANVDLVVCADGGAMHIAAGLGRPIVALFGDSDPVRWRPWGVPHRVLQMPTNEVADITAEQVIVAVGEVAAECGLAGRFGQFSIDK